MNEVWKEYTLYSPLSYGEATRRRVAAHKLEEFAKLECPDGWNVSEAVSPAAGVFIMTAKDGRQASVGYEYDTEQS